ncbi:hypothetical protein [Streptomyces collinus]|uniref:hypothetical protein n=1 Tax=Streptomyces collinus TaxID=42684 RepID=UPI0037D68BB1
MTSVVARSPGEGAGVEAGGAGHGVVDSVISTYCWDISGPKTTLGLLSGYRLCPHGGHRVRVTEVGCTDDWSRVH